MHWTLYPARSLSDYASQWDALNAASAASPMLDSRMYVTALEVFGSGHERLAVAKDARDEVVAMVLLAPGTALRSETFQPSQCPLGPMVKRSDVSLAQLGASLLAKLGRFTQLVGLTQLDPDIYARPGAGQPRIETLDYIETARIDLRGDFDTYWSARGKNLRQNMKKQRNRLVRDNTRIELGIVRDEASMRDAVATYGRLESASWKNALGTAVAPDNDQGVFYTRLLERFAATEQAMVVTYAFDKQTVACDLCVEGFGTLVILKTTYDEQFSKSSPAMLMREEWFPELFANPSLTALEFYGRVMDWHRKWSDDIRTLYHVNLWRSPLLRAGLLKLRRVRHGRA